MANKVPITRISKFFGEQDFNLNISMGEEWLYGDMNFTLVLYRVDKSKTNQDDVYGEALTDSVSYLAPIEIKAFVKIESPSQATFGNSKLSQTEPGNLIMSVYLHYLEEEGITISYGDYIGYPETETKTKYFTVSNDGKIFADNAHTIVGYKGFYRTITCVPTDLDEFDGR